ncbi:MAG: DUF1822 family protein [Cyanobacteria bacterium J06629_18]
MIDRVEDNLTFTMPLTLKAHQIANQFRQQQHNINKGKQVYLNTLAVQTVSSYLDWMGIETDLKKSDSWNPVAQTLADTADLLIKGKGKLECRPVLPKEQTCQVPLEVLSDRIGYVAVQFNQELTEATLLGFTSSVTAPEFPLEKLQSLDDLLEYLEPSEKDELAQTPVKLGQWLQGVVETSWQTVEELLGLSELIWRGGQPQLGWNVRSADSEQIIPAEAELLTTRGQLIDLGTVAEVGQVCLFLGVMPTNTPKMEIWVQVRPTGSQTHLPQELEVMVLDETGVAAMQAESRGTEFIQLKFSALPGERFGIKVVLDSVNVTKNFII